MATPKCEKTLKMTWNDLEKLSLKKRWKTSFCNSGESCWCRIIEPEEKMVDDSGNEIYIAGGGQIPKIYAEHIVKIHNKNLKNDIRGNKIKNKRNTKNDGL